MVDGDGQGERKWYRYGGMWKNKHEGVSARMPRKAKRGMRERRGKEDGDGEAVRADDGGEGVEG